MIPTAGRIVTTINCLDSNGSREHPAMITAGNDRDPEDVTPEDRPVRVNLTVFPDMSGPRCCGSVAMFQDRSAAEAYLDANTPNEPVCFWPDRKG